MKEKLLLLLLVFTGFYAKAQQEAQLTNFMFSQGAFNPGSVGSNDAICFTLLARQQWIGFKSSVDGSSGAPQTFVLLGETNIDKIRSGIGLSIIKDKIGFEDNIGVRFAYAYRLNVGQGKLGIGIQGGFLNKKIDFSKFKPKDASDLLLLGGGKESAMDFSLAFGLHYKIEDKLYAGFSSTQITESVSEFKNATLGTPTQKRHYYLYGGYYWQLPNMPELEINPNIMIKTDLAAAQYDINVLGIYNKMVYAGITYRVHDAFAVLGGMDFSSTIPGLKGGISYDATTSQLGYGKNRSAGTFEIWVNYCFKIIIPPTPSRHGTVRFL